MFDNNIFFTVSDEYISYLLKVENHVMQNKPENSMIPGPQTELFVYRIND